MSNRNAKKTVLITGCSPGGIGHALATEFHRKGLHVIATARNPAVLADLSAQGLTTLQLDVTDKASIKACHHEVGTITGGKLDILVNNAGRTHTIPATDIDLDDVRETFETNVFGVMAMCQAFADHLVSAQGLIINLGSVSAVAPYAFGSVYTASKGAVVSYSRTLRLELEPLGVRVMVAMAGTVRSNAVMQPAARRTLPPGSLYERVRHVFEWRRTFSQTQATYPTDVYARGLVAAALRPERPRFLRTWFGRPDWLWTGGMARVVWFGHSLGEWLADLVAYRVMRIAEVERILRHDVRRKLT